MGSNLGPNTPIQGGGLGSGNSNNSAPTVSVGNINPNQEFWIKIVSDSTNVNSGANVLLIQGILSAWIQTALSCAVPDQQHFLVTTTVSAGSSGGLTSFNQWINLLGCTIKYLRITTNLANTLFNNNLKYGIMPYTGISTPAYWPLTNYAVNAGPSGYNPTLIINTYQDGSSMTNNPWPITKDTYLYFDSYPASCTTTIFFGVAQSGETTLSA